MSLRYSRFAALFALLAGAQSVQGQQWQVSAEMGQMSAAATTAPASTSAVMLGLQYQGALWGYLGMGLPLAPESLSWATLGIGRRSSLEVGQGLRLGVDVAGQGYGFQDQSLGATEGGLVVEALPFFSLEGQNGTVEVRTGPVYQGGTTDGLPGGRALYTWQVRTSLALPGARVGGEGRYLREAEGAYPYLGGTLEMGRGGRVGVWGQAGAWFYQGLTSPAWGVGTHLRLNERMRINLSFQQEATDPLYWNPERKNWQVGISRTLGGGLRKEIPLPVPDQPRVSAGQVTFTLPAERDASALEIAGDFTGWKAVALQREGEKWTVTLPVSSGVHRYAFRDAAGNWFVPEGTPGRSGDGFGGVSAVLIVP